MKTLKRDQSMNGFVLRFGNLVFLWPIFTHGDPGAYWEAGFAEGLGKPVIYTCEKDDFR